MKNLAKDEEGNVILMTALVIIILLVLASLGTDLARAWVAREDMQTAVDSAALSGSRSNVRYVDVVVKPGYCVYNKEGKCRCRRDDPVVRKGTEEHMIEERGWKRHKCDQKLGILNRRIEYPSDADNIAANILNLNWPKLMTRDGGGEKLSSDIDIYSSRNSTYGPSVRVKAEGDIKTTLLKVIGIDTISTNRCGQSATFYDVIDNGWELGKNDAPQDACKGE